MIKNNQKLQKFYKNLTKKEHLSHKESFKIYEGLYREALHLKAIDHSSFQKDIAGDIKLARALNSLK